MFLNEKEEKIISRFFKNLEKIENKEVSLCWEKGTILAVFDTCFEDVDNETEEEFYSFSFRVLDVKGIPAADVTEDRYCLIYYKNFPDKIMLAEQKIN